jgi:hypothetical protein
MKRLSLTSNSTMKNLSLIFCAAVVLALSAEGGIIYSSYPNSGNIPDGDPAGWSATATVSGYQTVITSVSVSLDISGGYNGDLYAYLSYNGALLPLLNRVGVGTGSEPTYSYGYSGAGFTSLVLQDSGSGGDIHTYGGGVGTGTYSADGRNVDPMSSPATLYGTSQATFYSTFGGMNPNGTWTLFFADLSGGGGQSQLTGWSLDITAIPEPVNVALGIFAGVFLIVIVGRSRPVRNQLHRWRLAAVQWVNAV